MPRTTPTLTDTARRAGVVMRRVGRPLAIVACLLALGLLVVRGIRPAMDPFNNLDTAAFASASRAWLQGHSPYDHPAVDRVFIDSGGLPQHAPTTLRPGVYLFNFNPGAYALLSPLGAMPYEQAQQAWLALNIVALAVGIIATLKASGICPKSTTGLALIAAALAFGPAHTSLKLGQSGTLIFALLALVWWALSIAHTTFGPPITRPRRTLDWLAGVPLGVALVLKPHVAGAFWLYHVGRGRWRPALVALLIAGAAVTIGALRLDAAGIDWLPQWQANQQGLLAEEANPLRPLRDHPELLTGPQLVHLGSPIAVATGNRPVAEAAGLALAALIALAYAVFDARRGWLRGARRVEMLTLAAVSAVMLVAVYHRSYDAVVLIAVLPVLARRFGRSGSPRAADPDAGAACELVPPTTPHAPLTLAVLALAWLVVAVPGPSVLVSLEIAGRIPASLNDTLLYEAFIKPHHTWAILAIALACVRLRALTPAESPAPPVPSPA